MRRAEAGMSARMAEAAAFGDRDVTFRACRSASAAAASGWMSADTMAEVGRRTAVPPKLDMGDAGPVGPGRPRLYVGRAVTAGYDPNGSF